MTIAPDYGELYRAVDQLSPLQAEALYVAGESMLGADVPAVPPESPATDMPSTTHRLSFSAAGSGPSDLAERSRA